MLERKVMMEDGVVRDRHEIVQITHLVNQSTYIDVRSTHEDGTREYSWQFSIEPDDRVDLTKAYERLSALDKMALYNDPIDEVLDILTDDQAEEMTNLFPSWAAGIAYVVGDRRKHNGKLYRCVQAHTSQSGWEPNVTPALWVRTAEDGEIPEWVQPTGAQDAYAKGDKVTHSDKVWVSLIDGNVWEPGATGTESLWAEVTDEG